MHAMTRAGLLLGLCLGLAACPRTVQPPPPAPSVPPVQPQPPEPAPAAPSDIPTPSSDSKTATIYQIDPEASELHILVYRGGTFARLGHNHVMSSKSVTGRIWMQPRFAASGFEMSFPVAGLIVDDAAARLAAGSDFPPDIPAVDKEGTRKNMLRPEVLDAERYSRVEVKSVKVGGSLQAPQVTARITIKQASRDVAVPVVVAINGNRLTASGEFEILQTDFGIQPFSVALGALAVKDSLLVRFKLIADQR